MTASDEWSARAAITDVLARYARGLDTRDFDAVGACFAPEAQATFSGVRLPPGRAAIIAHLHGLLTLRATTHLFGLPVIELGADGATATAETPAIAVLVGSGDDGEELVRTRGLRYDDRFVRHAGGWWITDRVHRAVWMVSSNSAPLPSID